MMQDATSSSPFFPMRVGCAVFYCLISLLIPLFTVEKVFYTSVCDGSFNVFRFIWCFCCSSLGLGMIGIIYRNEKRSPFPEYALQYPIQLLAMSALVFGILHAIPQTSGFVFYYLSFGICFSLGYMVDHYWDFVRALIHKSSE